MENLDMKTLPLLLLLAISGCDRFAGCSSQEKLPEPETREVTKEQQGLHSEKKKEQADEGKTVFPPQIPKGQPVTIVPPAPAGKIHFGEKVAAVGTTVFVNAPEAPGKGKNTGAVYVYQIEGATTPRLVQTLLPSDSDTCVGFGRTLAANDRVILATAYCQEKDNQRRNIVYAFRLENGTWTATQKIVPDDPSPEAYFGSAIAIDGEDLLIGAAGSRESPGAVYAFKNVNDRWRQTQKFAAPDALTDDCFGCAIALSSNTALIGAPMRSEDDQIVGGAYAFSRKDAHWTMSQKLLENEDGSSDLSSFWGTVISGKGDIAVITAPGEGTRDPSEAYVYRQVKGKWQRTGRLEHPSKTPGLAEEFAEDVVVENGCIYVSVKGLNGGINGTTYVYKKSADKWQISEALPHSKSDEDLDFVPRDDGISIDVTPQIVVTSGYSVAEETKEYMSSVRVHRAVHCQ